MTSSLSALRLAVLQAAPAHDPQTALSALDQAAAGADLLIAPEMFLGGYAVGAGRIDALARQADRLATSVAGIARRHGTAILTGLARPGAIRPHNSAVLIGADGTTLGAYDKTHLYGEVDRAQFGAGAGFAPLVTLHGWRIGLAICFDIEFPETARALALAGADLIAVPTANMAPYDSVATRLVPARAEENALFVAYANYCGAEGDFDYCGLSCICGPDGNDLARAGRTPMILRATLDPAAIPARRAQIDHLGARRPDLY